MVLNVPAVSDVFPAQKMWWSGTLVPLGGQPNGT